jgi:hypothetical protein
VQDVSILQIFLRDIGATTVCFFPSFAISEHLISKMTLYVKTEVFGEHSLSLALLLFFYYASKINFYGDRDKIVIFFTVLAFS